jgi:hypothetical protein
MQSAQDCMCDDIPEALDRAPVRRILSERNMRTPPIIIGGEFRNDPCAPDLSLRLFLQAGLLLRNFRALVRILRVQAEQFALRQYLVFHRVHRCSTVKCSAEIERLV